MQNTVLTLKGNLNFDFVRQLLELFEKFFATHLYDHTWFRFWFLGGGSAIGSNFYVFPKNFDNLYLRIFFSWAICYGCFAEQLFRVALFWFDVRVKSNNLDSWWHHRHNNQNNYVCRVNFLFLINYFGKG